MSHVCEESSNCCWMKKLGDSGFGSRCLLRSILPGSHDSATCNISKSKPYASNAPPILLKAKRIYSGKRLKDLVVRWAIAQNRSIYEQLCDGIRYIDLRICSVKHPGDKIGSMYTCHSVISDKIEDIIEQVKTYTEQHPTEIIILDFNHFYDMDEPTHRHLAELLEEKLGSLMIPNTTPIDINIGSLWESGKSIYVFYEQNCKGLESYSFLWSQVHLYSAWMNTPDVSVLKNKLTKHLSFRKKVIDGEVDCKKRNYKKIFHVAQGIVTPDGKMIASGLLRGKFNSLEDLGNCVTPKFISWFSEEWKSLDLNILLADHYYNSNFVDVIIQMNRALLEG